MRRSRSTRARPSAATPYPVPRRSAPAMCRPTLVSSSPTITTLRNPVVTIARPTASRISPTSRGPTGSNREHERVHQFVRHPLRDIAGHLDVVLHRKRTPCREDHRRLPPATARLRRSPGSSSVHTDAVRSAAGCAETGPAASRAMRLAAAATSRLASRTCASAPITVRSSRAAIGGSPRSRRSPSASACLCKKAWPTCR